MERFQEGYSKIQGGQIMRVKNIKVAIKGENELLNEVKEVWGKLEKGEKIKKHEAIYFESLDAMRRILTEERLRMLKVIKKDHPASIYELSKMLKRDVKNTFDDVQFLVQAGLVELKKTKDVREKTTPTVNYDKILLEISV
jgi:predicted transcriptional regulator